MGLREIYICLVYGSFIVAGIACPFAFALGYEWLDIFYPQAISNAIASFPSSAVMGAATVFFYMAADRKFPSMSTHTVLTLAMAGWVSMTMLWAEAPEYAAIKYSWAFKTVLFSAFLPLFFRSRVQIEAFIQVFVFSISAYIIPVGLKTLLSGSSYGRSMAIGLSSSNSGLAESSALATVAVAIIPLALHLRRHSILVPKGRRRDIGYLALSFISIFCAVGTYARTAIIGFGVLVADMFIRARNKVLFVVLTGVIGMVVVYNVSSGWDERMSTIQTYQQENSAYTRILVWKWTMNYVSGHPLGGGFNDYVISHIEYPPEPGSFDPVVVVGRAFHSSFFEVLGEHGFPGIILFAALILTSLVSLVNIRRQTKGLDHLAWAYDLSGALRTAFLVTLAGGAFVGIAFQPPFWYFFAIIAALRHHVRVVLGNETTDIRRQQRRSRYLPEKAGQLVPAGRWQPE